MGSRDLQGQYDLPTREGVACLGPVTQAGCGAICPAYNRGCFGCFGPMESPNPEALSAQWKEMGVPDRDIMRAYRSFNGYASPFREESDRHDETTH